MGVLRFYQTPALSAWKENEKLNLLKKKVRKVEFISLKSEYCYYVEVFDKLSPEDYEKLLWILSPSFGEKLGTESNAEKLGSALSTSLIVEIGPRLNFSTAFCTNAVSISESVYLPLSRIERSVRYVISFHGIVDEFIEKEIVSLLHDRMTECRYEKPISSFNVVKNSESWEEVDLLNKGRNALENVSRKLGLSFDNWDLDFYTDLFRNKLKRNPTTVECFDLAQSNSEHSRHWFFKGEIIIDGKAKEHSLFEMIMKTQASSNCNNVIKFADNSSAIEGFKTSILLPKTSDKCSSFENKELLRHIIFTAETHNFPTGVAPFSGATTGTGGRIRDVHAAGRGAHVIAGTAAYSFGNLNIPGYILPWEDSSFQYPSNFALPLEVAIEASNGASDYGNKFGEPIILGFARSFGMKLSNGERKEYIKPIMFTGGLGCIDGNMIKKLEPQKGMLVVKIGGPVYRIGVGGGAASSVHIQGDQAEELDFGAVQRGDAEMEQKLNRVIRSCIELGDKNIICSIHDQGAGGNGNVLKEIVDPAGAIIYCSRFNLGDPTINVLELWGAEYQESDAILISCENKPLLQSIGHREKCPIDFVGVVTGDGKVILKEDEVCVARDPVDLELHHVLGSMPQKKFYLQTHNLLLKQLDIPEDLTLYLALERVLRLPSVASKRYLTNKVDRSVTGLISQQQCVGPLHTPLADVAVVALSYFDTIGSATSIGEQPIKGILCHAAGARMSVAEALTNLVFAKVTSLRDVKCSGNWMWAAKLPGEGAALYEACKAMCDMMSEVGIAIDGGKDSLSMAARVNNDTVKAPGTLVVSAYVPSPDIRLTVTPDLKCPNGRGILLHVDLSNGKCRLGGTALAQCFNQLGYEVPDIENPLLLRDAFIVTQELIAKKKLSAGHDISDGGLIVCLLEMAFAGNCGININVKSSKSLLETFFNEEAGWILEVSQQNLEGVVYAYKCLGIPCNEIGNSTVLEKNAKIILHMNNVVVLQSEMTIQRDVWEETSFQLETFQTNIDCVFEEKANLSLRTSPPYSVSFDTSHLKVHQNVICGAPLVAVIREEGINGDREMIAAFYMAGFEVWDVTMTDLLSNNATLDRFKGVVFPGGFSYADVLGSAKGWAAGLRYHSNLQQQFRAFRDRPDTFSLGVCNGCQLMALLGWVVPETDVDETIAQGVVLDRNLSERFESRFVTVKILDSPAIMLKGMINSVLGVWIAHGEGRFIFKNSKLLSNVQAQNLVPLVYVDDSGKNTEQYPFNPNGSVGGIASVCSSDGRHLAMMPHPERCVLPWQWPWMPQKWNKGSMSISPWLQMFQNAYDWCM